MAWVVRVKKKAIKKAREMPKAAKENLFSSYAGN